MKLHNFLENWGLINFEVDPLFKPVNPLLPKALNYKSPLMIDASSLVTKGKIKIFILLLR
jgi:hypothetical protein